MGGPERLRLEEDTEEMERVTQQPKPDGEGGF